MLAAISLNAAVIVSVDGPGSGGLKIGGENDFILATSWSSPISYSAVEIEVYLGVLAGDVNPPLTVYLMSQIGPGTTSLHQIATTTVSAQHV
jgi:hypothetical protein